MLDHWAKSETGLVRPSNQDAVGVYPEHGVFLVADGMGGHADGELASKIVVESIRQSLRLGPLQTNGNGPKIDASTLHSAIYAAHRAVRNAGVGLPAPERKLPMGSTVVALAVDTHATHVFWAHVGDSRLYRLRQGVLALLTADHTLYGSRHRGETPLPIEIAHTNILTQSLGTQTELDADWGEAPLQSGDLFLLCSDGISGMVPGALLEEILRDADSLAAAGNEIFQAAMAAGGRDNATLVLVRFTSSAEGSPPP